MKKLKYGMLFLAIVGIGVVSCEKEEVTHLSNKDNSESEQIKYRTNSSSNFDYDSITFTNSMVNFPSISYYESIVDYQDYSRISDLITHISQQTFQTYEMAYPNDTIIEDEFIRAILNSDKVVKIGEWLIKIDPLSNKVYTLSDQNIGSLANFYAENTIDVNVLEFSVNDDVLSYLKWGSDQEFGIACSETAASPDNRGNYWEPYCSNYKVKLKSYYQAYGIYKDLRIEFWHKEKNGRDNSTGFSIYYHYKWKKKCKDVDADATHVPVDSPPVSYEFGGWHHTIPLYHGSISLRKYYVSASCKFRSTCTLLNYNYSIVEMNHGY